MWSFLKEILEEKSNLSVLSRRPPQDFKLGHLPSLFHAKEFKKLRRELQGKRHKN